MLGVLQAHHYGTSHHHRHHTQLAYESVLHNDSFPRLFDFRFPTQDSLRNRLTVCSGVFPYPLGLGVLLAPLPAAAVMHVTDWGDFDTLMEETVTTRTDVIYPPFELTFTQK